MAKPPALPSRIVFMGTPPFAARSLKALLDAGAKPVAVFTRPDAVAGRGHKTVEPPVKAMAREAGIEVVQPKTLKTPEVQSYLKDLAPRVIVVVAYGQILPQAILDIPPLGCVNVHASLLPSHRGASPIAHAIWAGDKETGVTTMKMEAGLDTGPAYLQEKTRMPAIATTGSLTELLSEMGAGLLLETLRGLEAGSLQPVPQDDSIATQAPRLTKAQGMLDFSKPAAELERQIRAFEPWPGTFFTFKGETIKVRGAALGPAAPNGAAVGEVVSSEPFAVACGCGGMILFTTLQREGKRLMPASEVLRGFHIQPGSRL